MGRFVDLIGRRFSKLTVITRAENAKCNRVRWNCICDCGNKKIAFSNLLQREITRDCGDTTKHESNRGGAQYKYHGLAGTAKYKMYMAAKFRAKQKKLPFTLKLSEMPEIPEHCPILGFVLEKGGKGRGLRDKSPSLDKIVPEKGYASGNVQVISGKANKMKANATTDEIGKLYHYMVQLEKEIIG